MNFVIKVVLLIFVIVSAISQTSRVTAIDPQELNIENLPEWRVSSRTFGGTLLLSDSPEMVPTTGILYQDKVLGDARLFFYHVNATGEACKMDVIIENAEQEAAHITVRRSGIAGPGYAWMAVGKAAMTSYLSADKPAYQINIPPGGALPLSYKISNTAVLPNMLINGIYDFTADRPVTVKVLMRPLFEETFSFAKHAQVLSADKYHLRGTFKGADRQLVPEQDYNPVRDGAVAITLADNDIDPYLEGFDAIDQSTVVNYGNYGVVYNILFPSQGKGQLAYYFAPLGGAYAGAVGIKHSDIAWSPRAVPQGQIDFGGKAGEFAFLGTFDIGDPLAFTFSPAGASNLPVRILVLPQ